MFNTALSGSKFKAQLRVEVAPPLSRLLRQGGDFDFLCVPLCPLW
jgi:hypothetical protein